MIVCKICKLYLTNDKQTRCVRTFVFGCTATPRKKKAGPNTGMQEAETDGANRAPPTGANWPSQFAIPIAADHPLSRNPDDNKRWPVPILGRWNRVNIIIMRSLLRVCARGQLT